MNSTDPDTSRFPENPESGRAAILRARARKLARPLDRQAAVQSGPEVLVFAVGDQRYALPITSLREVYSARGLTPLPGTPDFILGVIAVRGQVVAVMDLGIVLGRPPTAHSPGSQAVVLGNERMTTAILADRIEGLITIEDEDLQAGEPSGARLDSRFVTGVTGDRVVLLAADALLSDPEFIVNQ